MHCCYREQLSYALYAKFREPKLYRMAVSGDWDEIPARCRTHPKEAAFVHKYAPNDTALHRLLRPSACLLEGLDAEMVCQMNQLKLAAAEALLGADRQAAALRDSFGRTPLHLACMDAAHDGGAVAATILEANPAAAAAVDAELRTPLHFLVARCPRGACVPAALAARLIRRHPGAVFRQDAVGDAVPDIVRQREGEIGNAGAIARLLADVPDPRRASSSSSSRGGGMQRGASDESSKGRP